MATPERRIPTSDDYIKSAKAVWKTGKMPEDIRSNVTNMQIILDELQADLRNGLIDEETALLVLQNPMGPTRAQGGMAYRDAISRIQGWDVERQMDLPAGTAYKTATGDVRYTTPEDVFAQYQTDVMPSSMFEATFQDPNVRGSLATGGAAYTDPVTGVTMPGYKFDRGAGLPAGSFGWTDEGWDYKEGELGPKAQEQYEKQQKDSGYIYGAGGDLDWFAQERARAEAERQALLAGQARQEETAGLTPGWEVDPLLAGVDADPVGGVDAIPDSATASAGVTVAEDKVAAAETPQEKTEAKADLAKAKSIQKQSEKVASDRAKQAKATGIRDEKDLKNKILNDPDFSSLDAETWLINNRGFTASKASETVQGWRTEAFGGPAPAAPGAPGVSDTTAGMALTPQWGTQGQAGRQMIQTQPLGPLPTPSPYGISLAQSMASPEEAFQQYRLAQFGGQPSVAELARAQRTRALYSGYQPAMGRFLLSATRPGSDIDLGAFAAGQDDEQLEGEAFARYLRAGQRAPMADIRSSYGGLADYLSQIATGSTMPGGAAGLRYGAVFGEDLGPKEIKGRILNTTMASLGMRPGMGQRAYGNLSNIYDTMQAQYGQEVGAANFARWVAGGLGGEQQQPSAFNNFAPLENAYTPAQQATIRQMRPTSSDVIGLQAKANQMTGGYIGGGWSPEVTQSTYGALEDPLLTRGGF